MNIIQYVTCREFFHGGCTYKFTVFTHSLVGEAMKGLNLRGSRARFVRETRDVRVRCTGNVIR